MKTTIMTHVEQGDAVRINTNHGVIGKPCTWLQFDIDGQSIQLAFPGGFGLEAIHDVIGAHLRDGERHEATIRGPA